MNFKTTEARFQMLDLALIEPDPNHLRQHIDDDSLTGLVNSIAKAGLIHPLVVQPADTAGRHRLIVGERRRRAAQLAGETTVPVLVRACEPAEALEIRVFENLGLGVRAALEPREMAHAIQHIAERFDSPEAAAGHFARSPTWLSQATAAANLSPKVSALLDAGKISSTSTAVQLDKLARKDEVRAGSLIEKIEQLPEGEKLPAKAVAAALSEAGGKRRKKEAETPEAAAEPTPPAVAVAPAVDAAPPPWEETPAAPNRRINPGKMQMVARMLGLSDGDEDEILARLIDEFLALKGEEGPSP